MQVELIAITRYLKGDGTPEELLEHAGRVCYRSESRGNPGRFLRARISAKTASGSAPGRPIACFTAASPERKKGLVARS